MTSQNDNSGSDKIALAPSDLRAFVDRLKQEFGNEPDLIKQSLADLNALQRQEQQISFQSRQEYVRHVAELKVLSLTGIREYGLQTLKWSFLLNAGAIGVVLAYVSGSIGKTPTSTISTFAPMLNALWPFVMGCTFVVLAGAAGFLNFSYGEATLPSPESLHEFLGPSSKSWPQARYALPSETRKEFYRRFAWKVTATRVAAIGFAFGSVGLFSYGVYQVLRAALK
jgi:hypothetical protein